MIAELAFAIVLLAWTCVLVWKENLEEQNKIELIQWKLDIQNLKGGHNP